MGLIVITTETEAGESEIRFKFQVGGTDVCRNAGRNVILP